MLLQVSNGLLVATPMRLGFARAHVSLLPQENFAYNLVDRKVDENEVKSVSFCVSVNNHV